MLTGCYMFSYKFAKSSLFLGVYVYLYNPVHSKLFTHNFSAKSSSQASLLGAITAQSEKYSPTFRNIIYTLH